MHGLILLADLRPRPYKANCHSSPVEYTPLPIPVKDRNTVDLRLWVHCQPGEYRRGHKDTNSILTCNKSKGCSGAPLEASVELLAKAWNCPVIAYLRVNRFPGLPAETNVHKCAWW